ncbi:MAG: NHL repeat-containing protein [Candidatus Aminicenantes bacterium]|nr:MAG: NHL repeat-containing protein [Candidatus Aminicenantes bacterium]
MKKNAIFVIFFIFFITIVFCCPSTVWAGSVPNKKKPGVHQLHSPIRLTMTPEGNLLVSDYQLGMIVTVDHKTLKATRWFPVEGRPLGVAYARGHIYVGNASKGCVEVYARGGKKLYQLGSVGEPIKQPTDIAIDENKGYVFVVDGSAKKVKVFDWKGKFIRFFPGLDPNNEELTNPTGITLDPANKEVFVSDYGDRIKYIYPRIQIFDYNGNLLDTIPGKKGMFGLRFSRPQGLAVDESGHVFMLDCYSGEIMVFDRYNGQTLKTMAGYGTDPGQLRLPLDIVINPTSKDIYVTNNRSATIEIFEKGGVL